MLAVVLLWFPAAHGSAQDASRDPNLAEGRGHWNAGRYTESAAAYRRATRTSPADPRAFAGLGRAYTALGADAFAEPAYRRAIALSTSPSAALSVAHGDCLSRLGDRMGAALAYRAAIRRDPTHEVARARLGLPAVLLAPRPVSRQLDSASNGVPFVAVGVPLAVIGLATALGCGISYGLERDVVGSGRAGTDPLTWAGCIGTGAVLTTAGLALLGIGLAVGVSAPMGAGASDLRVNVGARRDGVGVSLRGRF